MTGRSNELSRRRILRAGALAALAAPLVSACSAGVDENPDPLAALLAQAQATAGAAAGQAAAATALTGQVAALKAEVDRLNRPKAATPSTPTAGGIKGSLAALRKQATTLLPSQSAYRAGLVASVAAGCAGLQRVTAALGPGDDAGSLDALATTKLTGASVDAVQQALAAEYAAIWIYGLATAYLPGDYGNALTAGSAEHQQRRDLCERALTASGATPAAPEAAYVPPKPVTDGPSAMAVIATAEGDAASAWLGVAGRAGDSTLRALAGEALIACVRRATPWRMEGGQKPPVEALPGMPA
ncbi:MAG: hypothetical protein JWQ81_3267 [Amycolatopsis sp.]|uniref:ferritin-like domain-containing protein n=1 Tax=Amycolatopsis sp. TaxID=37632 RepID=UPI002612BC5C|nr:DUF4439 domain-containing protein [Amycolatopsis sp.]MCU1682528.1 hypothetical protein [Amycolatopsis sp.]